MVGTRGVPARYGGFETAVEEVGSRLVAAGHRVVVYCRTVAGDHGKRPGAAPRHGAGAPAGRPQAARWRPSATRRCRSRTSWRTAPDAAFVFNAANAPLLPLLRAARIPVATHVDGLEWKRAKWGGGGRRYYRARRVPRGALVRRPHRRRRRHRRLLPPRVRRADDAAHLRCAAHRPGLDRLAELDLARVNAAVVSPGRDRAPPAGHPRA